MSVSSPGRKRAARRSSQGAYTQTPQRNSYIFIAECRRSRSPTNQAAASSMKRANILSPLPRLVPAKGMFSLPFHDWCPLRVCSLSPSAIGAR
eukprot:1096896-Prorocentrum_minimum.AAC.3